MRYLVIVVALAVAPVGIAHADGKAKAISGALADALSMSPEGAHLPPIVLLDSETKFKEPFLYGDGSPTNELLHVVVGLAADGHAGWVAADTGVIMACGMEGCAKILRDAAREATVKPPFHHTALVEDGKVLFLHIGSTGKGVGIGLPMETQIADDARPVVEQFQKSIADPKALAATISARKDVVLYGTEPTERFVGGAAARATLLKWDLSLAVQGGIRAGVTRSKAVAWIAADVEARSAKSKTTLPYRLTVVYEKTGAEWKIVQLHFS
jgi:hypothetical protein